ncbi:MAG: hypothetical protein F6K55_31085 [Moorea sp. SIO4A3]|nr:hypothetical protein [Moorena sp. SIO4A3]
MIFTLFLDAVAHGGNPQDRAASLVEVFRLVGEGVKGFATVKNDQFNYWAFQQLKIDA